MRTIQEERSDRSIFLVSEDNINAHPRSAVVPQEDKGTLLIFDTRVLDRDCLAQGLRAKQMPFEIVACGTIAEWRQMKGQHPPVCAVLLCIGRQRPADAAVGSTIAKLVAEYACPVVVLADNDELVHVLKALELGAKGYIPTSVQIDVCIEAINLALAGGVFLPASSVLAMRRAIEAGNDVNRPMSGMFTQRQEEVVSALRRGKANKIIAYELNLRESTVKVHIRNIMRKLKATNRTEVAYKINEMFPEEMHFQS
jgi:DNA-binding NarL/FixJ family response regulator